MVSDILSKTVYEDVYEAASIEAVQSDPENAREIYAYYSKLAGKELDPVKKILESMSYDSIYEVAMESLISRYPNYKADIESYFINKE